LIAPHRLGIGKLSRVDPDPPYRITTVAGRSGQPKVDTYGDIAEKYAAHPEAKALRLDGKPCGRRTVGPLQRRPVIAGEIKLIGKESNRLEDRFTGLLTIDELDERLTAYHDDDGWRRITLPRLRELDVRRVAKAAGISERRTRDILSGRVLPHRANCSAIENLIAHEINERKEGHG